MNTNTETITNLTPEEEVLQYTQDKRKKIVESIMIQGVPSDKGEKAILLQALADMDRPALVKMRIKSEDKNASGNAAAALAIANLMSKVSLKSVKNTIPSSNAPILETEKLPEFGYVEGETLIGTQSGSYNEFVDKMG